MQRNDQYDRRESTYPPPASRPQGSDVLWNAALLFGLCVALASLVPGELFAAALSSILVFATISCALTALLRGEAPLGDGLTHWDAAAVFMATSIILSWGVDPEAVDAFLAAESQR